MKRNLGGKFYDKDCSVSIESVYIITIEQTIILCETTKSRERSSSKISEGGIRETLGTRSVPGVGARRPKNQHDQNQ